MGKSGKDLAKLLKRLREGDQSAFLPFYEKTAPGLLRFLLWKSRGDRPLAEDILQESFVRLLLKLDRLESLEDLAVQSYLLQTVKNCFIDKVGRVPKGIKNQIPLDEVYDLADTAQSLRQERAVELRELSVAMNHLNERESEVIWLRDALGLSHREVANQIGISEEASRQAYVRAKRALMSELGPSLLPVSSGGDHYATP